MFVQRQCHLPPTTLKSRYLITKFGLWLFLIMGIFRPLTIGPACALEITSHIKYYYVARDSSVTLNCEFVLYSENLGHMDIEWNILAENRDQSDNIIIWYTAAMIYNNLYGPLKHRCYFTSAEPQNGIASLTITDLKLTDSGTYQCKVKKLPEIGIKNFILSVMERPSMPVCYMDGEAVAGEDLRLRCRSSQGTPPMDYRWSKTSGNQKLPHTAVADTIGGDLYLDKITESDTGTYLCTVLNLVGKEECELELSFPPPLTMYYVYVTIAAAIVSVVLVIIIAVIFHRQRKETEEEFSNEILEDELPPHTWRSRESHTLGSSSYISSQDSVQAHTVSCGNMDSSLRTKCTDKDAVCKVLEQQDLKEKPEAYGPIENGVIPHVEAKVFCPWKSKSVELMKHGGKTCGEGKKTMEKNMTNNDVRNADGEGHEEDKKEKPEAYGPIEHGVTPHVEAKVFCPWKSKSVELMKHGGKTCGEGKETMEENMTKIDVRNPDGEGHEEDKELCVSQKKEPEVYESFEHGETACEEVKKTMRENVSEIDVCTLDGDGHERDKEEKPEAYGPIEHGVTPHVEAKVFCPWKSKSVELMKHGGKTCGEGKETMEENMTKIDVRNPDGEGHEEDKELCVSQKKEPEVYESFEHGETACEEVKKTMRENVSEIDVCTLDWDGHERDKELCSSQREKWRRMD